MTDAELEFIGIKRSLIPILDTDEKVKQLAEELRKAIEPNAKKWDIVKRESWAKAHYTIL
jgi:hypothetical protein